MSYFNDTKNLPPERELTDDPFARPAGAFRQGAALDDFGRDISSQPIGQQGPGNFNQQQQQRAYTLYDRVNQDAQQQQQFVKNLSLTGEDIIFMRSCQKEAYTKRVIPMSIFGMAVTALWARYKGRNLPIIKMTVVAGLSYFLGQITYYGEFKRRLQESPLNTPYMNALRARFGLTNNQGLLQDPAASASPISDGFDMVRDLSLGWDLPVASDAPFVGSSNDPQSSFGGPASRSDDDPVKSDLTYEELRARNRGGASFR